jgi:hypothetical protein
METKPEKKTTTIIVTADLLRQLDTPSSSSKEGLRTNNQGNKNNAFKAQTTRSSSKNQKGEKKNQKNREKRGKITSRFPLRKIPQRHKESSQKNHRNGKKDGASSAIARELRPVEPPWLQRSVDT